MAKSGGRPKKETNGFNKKETIGFEKQESKTKPNVNANVNENVNVNVNDNANVVSFEKVIDVYENNIAPATEMSIDMLQDYYNEMDGSLIIEAIKKSVLANSRNGRYINGILKDWRNKGFKSLIDAKNEEEKFKKQHENQDIKESEEEKNKRKLEALKEGLANDTK